MTSKKLSSILAQWRHCRAAVGCGITVIRWRGPGFTGLVASVVRDPPCSEHLVRVSTVMGEKLQTDNWTYRLQWQFPWNKATGEDQTALKQNCLKKGWGEFKLRKTVGMSVVRWWANCTIPSRCQLSTYISTSATSAAQQQRQQQPPNSSQHNTWYSCGLWLNLHPVTTTASRNWSEFCCCVTKAKSIISTKYFSYPSPIHSWIEILHQ